MKKVNVTTQMEEEMNSRLELLAKERECSKSAIIRQLVKDGLKRIDGDDEKTNEES